MADAVSGEGSLSIRPLRDEPGDYALMARWLSDPRILEWYHGRDDPLDAGGVVARYGPRALGDDPMRPHVVEWNGRPIGYVQCYPLDGWAETSGLVEEPRGAWGIDYFIGEPNLWGRGLGTRAVEAMVRHLFEDRGAARVVSDPRADNPRSIRMLEKAGFRRVRLLPDHERHEGAMRDCVLMERMRQ